MKKRDKAQRPGPETLVPIARVVRPHGLKGELLCDILTDFPDRFQRTPFVYLGSEVESVAVESSRLAGGRVVLKLRGVSTRGAAERLRGRELAVPADQLVPLPAGSYYWHQLAGLAVETDDGRLLGQLRKVLPTGSNDVYVVDTARGELLLPAIAEVVREIDIEAGVMRVRLLPGLEN